MSQKKLVVVIALLLAVLFTGCYLYWQTNRLEILSAINCTSSNTRSGDGFLEPTVGKSEGIVTITAPHPDQNIIAITVPETWSHKTLPIPKRYAQDGYCVTTPIFSTKNNNKIPVFTRHAGSAEDPITNEEFKNYTEDTLFEYESNGWYIVVYDKSLKGRRTTVMLVRKGAYGRFLAEIENANSHQKNDLIELAKHIEPLN